MVEIILIAKIWFWIRITALGCTFLSMTYGNYESTVNQTFQHYINFKLFGFVEGVFWTFLLYWLIWMRV